MTVAQANSPQPNRRVMFHLVWWYPLAVFLAAFALRVFNVGRVVNFLDDRWTNVPAAFNYANFGFTGPDNWFTQPVKHLLMYWNIQIFGNGPIGWSMRQVLFGAGVVVLTYLLARRMFRVHFPALFAAVLVALDPLSIAFSRASSEDPIAVFFILCAMLFWVRAIQDDRDIDLFLAGIFIGIASATRWYALLIALVLFAIALIARRRTGTLPLIKTALLLSVVPLSAYLVWFFPWMQRGHSLGDLWSLQVDSYLVQLSGTYPTFDPALAGLTGPGGWFTRWIGLGAESGANTFAVIMNNPVLWLLFLPAVAYVGWIAYRRRLPEFWMLSISFVVLYGFFATANRPIYLYSALPLVPLGFIAAGYAAARLLRRNSLFVLGAAALWSAYLYPLTSSITVPIAPYAWLLARVGLSGGGG